MKQIVQHFRLLTHSLQVNTLITHLTHLSWEENIIQVACSWLCISLLCPNLQGSTVYYVAYAYFVVKNPLQLNWNDHLFGRLVRPTSGLLMENTRSVFLLVVSGIRMQKTAKINQLLLIQLFLII